MSKLIVHCFKGKEHARTIQATVESVDEIKLKELREDVEVYMLAEGYEFDRMLIEIEGDKEC